MLFENDDDIIGKFSEGDTNIFRKIGLASQKGINPEEIVDAYESNNTEIMENMYKKAKK